jgi:hypothetical protein
LVDASVDSAGLFSEHPIKQVALKARLVTRTGRILLIIDGFCFLKI